MAYLMLGLVVGLAIFLVWLQKHLKTRIKKAKNAKNSLKQRLRYAWFCFRFFIIDRYYCRIDRKAQPWLYFSLWLAHKAFWTIIALSLSYTIVSILGICNG